MRNPPVPSAMAQPAAALPLSIVCEDEDLIHGRALLTDPSGKRISVLVARPKGGASNPAAFERLLNEYRMRDRLDASWAMRPLDLQRHGDSIALVLEDAGGTPLERLLTERLSTGRFLTLATGIAAAVHRMHARDIVHCDLKPEHLFVDDEAGLVRITGFGIASDVRRDRERTSPPDIIAGTMAYMAPEQTGRLNCPIDARTDLYSMGVVFYRMLTGTLPFSAASATEWMHSHTARKPVPPHLRVEQVDAQLSAIVMKLLEKEPGAAIKARPGSNATFAAALRSGPSMRRSIRSISATWTCRIDSPARSGCTAASTSSRG
ncbi:serine/threonine protein kinase [Burkholderia territorii]|uniref:serine/threonine protein kinase n=1 Tax=Burkholderia territorii TaxID=1503055 RepID=UPI000A5CB180|nr:serine/threonine-protein kinase [Burkholderia territorii]